MPICLDCNSFYLHHHICPQQWEAVAIERGDDPENPERIAYGNDAESAALWLAQDKFTYWECPSEMEIWVRESSEKNGTNSKSM